MPRSLPKPLASLPRPSTRPSSLMTDTSGDWPADFLLTEDGRVEEGVVVLSRSGKIEGRTTGSRRRCSSTGCPGWFIGVSWETGQRLFPCSEGWRYDVETNTVRIMGGGEISARVISPPPLGVAARPRDQWPDGAALRQGKGWRKDYTLKRNSTTSPSCMT